MQKYCKTLYEHTSSEGHDTGPKVTRMEGHIDTRKGNRSKSTLQFNVTLCSLLGLCLLEALLNNLTEHFLDLINSELLSKLKTKSV